jgi:hypothetical protein
LPIHLLWPYSFSGKFNSLKIQFAIEGVLTTSKVPKEVALTIYR